MAQEIIVIDNEQELIKEIKEIFKKKKSINLKL